MVLQSQSIFPSVRTKINVGNCDDWQSGPVAYSKYYVEQFSDHDTYDLWYNLIESFRVHWEFES